MMDQSISKQTTSD